MRSRLELVVQHSAPWEVKPVTRRGRLSLPLGVETGSHLLGQTLLGTGGDK